MTNIARRISPAERLNEYSGGSPCQCSASPMPIGVLIFHMVRCTIRA